MRPLATSALVLPLLFPFIAAHRSSAQTSTPGQVHCAFQKQVSLTNADRIFLSGDASHAEAMYAAQLSSSPTIANFTGLVKSQIEQNKLTEALATAKKANDALPSSAAANVLVGNVQERSGHIAESLAAYKRAFAIDACSPQAHLGIARIDELNSAHASAAREISMAHQLAPADPDITVAFIASKPATEQLAGLKALQASNPALLPAALETLSTQIAILDQGKSCTRVESETDSTIELLPVLFNGKYARSWGLRTKLNNGPTPLLELDTSVSGIVLNTSDAKKAGVKPLIASASQDSSYEGYVDHVHIGNMDFRDCPVRVVPDAAVAGSNSLIGTDFFRDRLIHIDYVASTLSLKPLPKPDVVDNAGRSDRFMAAQEQGWSPVFISGPAVLLPTLINKKGPFLFMLDTGNYRSVISPAVTESQLVSQQDRTLNLQGTSATIVKVLRRDGGGDVNRTEVHGNDGHLIPVSTPLKLPVYHFTNNEYPDQNSVSFDLSPLSHATGTEVSGLLGFGVLRSYSLDINYRDGLARVLFDQNRIYETRNFDGFH